MQAAINMTFGRKIQYGIKPVRLKHRLHLRGIADVPFNKRIASIRLQPGQVLKITRVGQGIEVDDFHIGMRFQCIPHKITADKSSAAGDQPFHLKYCSSSK